MVILKYCLMGGEIIMYCQNCGMLKINCICGKYNKSDINRNENHEINEETKTDFSSDTVENESQVNSKQDKIQKTIKENFPFSTFLEDQLEILTEMVDAIEEGYKYIILESDVGKSAIAATLANIYKSSFILSDNEKLQEKYHEEYDLINNDKFYVSNHSDAFNEFEKLDKRKLLIVDDAHKFDENIADFFSCAIHLSDFDDELIIDKIKDLFNSNRFEAGKLLIDDMISTNENKVIYSKLFNTYYYFDNVDYKKALENFDLKIFKETWPELAIDFQKNIIALNILNKQNQDSNDKTRFVDHKQKKYYMLASIINNSKRRGKENKFDDAVARLYRSFELIAQIRLLEKYNIDSSNVDIDILKEYGLADDYLAELENSRDKKYNDIKLGLIKDYVLLEQLNDDLGKFYLENENKIRNIIKFRNNSILAHGFEFCSEEDFEEFKEIVLKAADLLNKNMGRFIEETKFPMFS